jgi:inhibitor of cysteine peptidase
MEQPVTSDNTPDATIPVNSDESQQRVYIDTIQTNIMESFPLQVSVTINGNLPDGCTSIINSKTNFDSNKNTFTIQIFTERPKDLMCTQALVPFTETIPLDVYGFPAGIYTVNAYQLSTTFKFDFDNKISE